MDTVIRELVDFLQDDKVKQEASAYIAGLTGSPDGITILLKESARLFPLLLKCLHDDNEKVTEQVYATLINLSLDDQACKKLLSLGVVERVIEILREDKAKDLNLAAKLLSNLTLKKVAIDQVLQKGKGALEGFFVSWIVQALISDKTKSYSATEYFAAVLTNISQDKCGRNILLESKQAHLKVINNELVKTQTPLRQESLAKVIRNICMATVEDESIESIIEGGTIPTIFEVLSESEKYDRFTKAARKALLEGIMCIGSSEDGMQALWKAKVPDTLQKVYEKETDADICEVLERCADIFISSSGQSPIEELDDSKD